MPGVCDETEAKFKVKSFSAVRRALRAEGGEYLGTVLQTDRYLDTASRSLLNSDTAVRVRTVKVLRSPPHGQDRRPLLTFKGPIARGKRSKRRREIQTRVDDGAAVVEILRSVGLTRSLMVQKRRASYRMGRCLVELDELPLIGRFVEIEGPNTEKIEAARRKLKLEGKAITDHYLSLLAAGCKRAGRQCGEITFDGCSTRDGR